MAGIIAGCYLARRYAVRTQTWAAEAEAHALAAEQVLRHVSQVHEQLTGKPMPDTEEWLREQLGQGSRDLDQ
jgi:hypothetical protein